jgi:hypothetical protein
VWLSLHHLWLASACRTQTKNLICCVFFACLPASALQHYAQCELLPRDDEIADKTLAGQFAVSAAHQTA